MQQPIIINTDDETIEALYNALKVIQLDRPVAVAIKGISPKTLEQVEAAIARAEATPDLEVSVSHMTYDGETEFTIVADFRVVLGDNGNYDFADHVRNNFEGDIVVDPELSGFHAYTTTEEATEAFTDFIVANFPAAKFI